MRRLPFGIARATFQQATGLAALPTGVGAPLSPTSMPRNPARALLLVVAAAAALACDDETTTTPPIVGGILEIATYYLHAADTLPLPAKIHERTAGVALEETIVDSARLSFLPDRTYQQRVWLRVRLNSVPDRSEVMIDEGVFYPEGSGYRLTSSVRNRQFTLTIPLPGQLESREQILFLEANPPITTGTYRLTRP